VGRNAALKGRSTQKNRTLPFLFSPECGPEGPLYTKELNAPVPVRPDAALSGRSTQRNNAPAPV